MLIKLWRVQLRSFLFLNLHFSNILQSKCNSFKWSLSFSLSHEEPTCISPLSHTRPSYSYRSDHPNTTHVFGEEYRSWSSSLRSLLHFPVISVLWDYDDPIIWKVLNSVLPGHTYAHSISHIMTIFTGKLLYMCDKCNVSDVSRSASFVLNVQYVCAWRWCVTAETCDVHWITRCVYTANRFPRNVEITAAVIFVIAAVNSTIVN